MTIKIMNLSKTKPTEKYDFVCDRTSPVGNPKWDIETGYVNWRNDVCDKYEIYFHEQMNNTVLPIGGDHFKEYINTLIKVYRKYGVLRLFCWCSPKRCHIETIRNYIFKQTIEEW